MSRADRLTPTTKKVEYYSDLPMNMDKSPITQSLSRLTNERDVAQAMKNLVLTSRGERLYQPRTGGNVNAFLFDPVDTFTADALQTLISETLTNHEPRAVADVKVNELSTHDGYDVTITYYLVNNTSQRFNINFFLQRAR